MPGHTAADRIRARRGQLPTPTAPVAVAEPETATASEGIRQRSTPSDFNIQDFLTKRQSIREGEPIPIEPRPPSTAGVDRLSRIARDLFTRPERGSAFDFGGGPATGVAGSLGALPEALGDLFQLGPQTGGRYLGSLPAQGRTPFRDDVGFNEAERFFQTLPQDTQAGLEAVFDPVNFVLPPVAAGGAAIRGGREALETPATLQRFLLWVGQA